MFYEEIFKQNNRKSLWKLIVEIILEFSGKNVFLE